MIKKWIKKNTAGIRLLLLLISLVLLSGCASPLMVKVQQMGLPDDQHAMVVFVRPSYFSMPVQKFGIWDSENFVGNLWAGSYIQYVTTPGKHLFLARAENWSYVMANLQPGKRYIIIANVFPGIWKGRVALDPVRAHDPTTDAQINDWLYSLRPTAFVERSRQRYVQPRIPLVRAAIEEYNSGNVLFLILKAEDFR